MSQSNDSLDLLSERSSPDEVPNGLPIVLGSRFQLEILEFPRLDDMRVKLYVCHDRQWKDLGTGYVICHDDAESFIVFRLEDEDTNFFESLIKKDCIYTVQQETLICWEEYDTEVALSFQKKSGCTDFYARLGRILGKNPATGQAMDDSEFSSMSDAESDEMPPLEMARLFEMEQYIADHMHTAMQRGKLANEFDKEDFMPKLVELFQLLEDINDHKHLEKLGTIAKTLFLMDKFSLLEKVVDDRYLKDVIGMLEYNVSAAKRAKHRRFVYDQSEFKEIVPIGDADCIAKIHKLYRLQYILDQCMPQPSILEETLTGTLSLYNNNLRSEIFQNLLDSGFVKNLFSELELDLTKVERRRSLIQLFVDFIDLGIQVAGSQSQQGALFSDLFARDILSLQLPCIQCPDTIVRQKSVEVLDRLVTFNAPMVLSFLYKQATEDRLADSLPNRLLLLLLEDTDPELSMANRVADLMQNVLSPEPPLSPDRGHFLNFFYRISLRELVVAFLMTIRKGRMTNDDYHTANKAYCIISFFTSCLQLDRARFHPVIEEFDVITTVLVVLQSKHHFLALGGLRLLRQAVGFLDPVFDQYVVKNDSFAPVIECARKNRLRENMMKSAILELFSFLSLARRSMLVKYVMEDYGDTVKGLMPNVYEELRSQYEYRHPPQGDKMANKVKEMVLKLEAEISISKENPGMKAEKVDENSENTGGDTSSVLKPKNIEVKRSLSEDEEREVNGSKEKAIKNEENIAEVVVQKPLVDYAGFSDSDESDDQGDEENEAKEPATAPRPGPGTPRPALPRVSKRPSVVWDENDKPPPTQEAKKACEK